jgi:HEAT repeat protein
VSAAPAQLSDLGGRLTGPDPVVGRLAEDEVRSQGPDALPWLFELLGNDKWESVPRAARLVGEADELAVPELVRMVSDPKDSFRVASAFRFLTTRSAEEPLLGLLQGGQADQYGLRAVGEYGYAEAAPELVKYADSRRLDPSLLAAAFEALELMLLAQDDGRPAAGVLVEIERLALGVMASAIPRGHPAWHTHRLGRGWAGQVLDRLDAPTFPAPWLTARELEWFGLARALRAIPVLGRTAADPSVAPLVRMSALTALAEIDTADAFEAVARAAPATTGLQGDDLQRFTASVDSAAARLAGHSEDPARLLRETLARATTANDAITRSDVLRSLGHHGDAGDISVVQPMLTDSDWIVRAAAAVTLARLQGAASLRRLEAAYSEASDPGERVEIASALSLVDPVAYGDELHQRLCDQLDLPWALLTPIKANILDGLSAGGTDDGRAAAWAEVLRMPPPAPAATPHQQSSKAPPQPRRQPEPVETPVTVPSSEPISHSEASSGRPPAQADIVAKKDQLGRDKLINVLLSMLTDPDQGTPFTFGLFGGWGEGKSSVIEQLITKLAPEDDNSRFAVARFNAWQYEKSDSPAAGLMQEAVRGLRAATRRGRIAVAVRYAWARHRWKIVRDLIVLVVGLGAAALAVISGQLGKPVITVVFGAGVASVASVIAAVATRLYRNPVAAQLLTHFHLPDYEKQLGPLPAMRDDLEKLWEVRRTTGINRLVVFVDDLDRCSADAITATLDAVRLVVDLEGVIVILALDERILLSAVAHKYQQLTTMERSADVIARDFLAKIVQLPIRLEPAESLETFISDGLFGGEIVTERSAPTVPARLTEDQSQVPRPDAERRISPSGAAYQGTAESVGAYESGTVGDSNPLLVQEAMRETPDERQVFGHLAQAAGISNPRLLRRVRNTYRFLKAMWVPQLEWRKLMTMLFWQEVLYDLSGDAFNDRRTRSELVTYDGDPMPRALATAVAAAFTDPTKLTEYRRAVSLAVLPRLEIAAPRSDNAADSELGVPVHSPEVDQARPVGVLGATDAELSEAPRQPAA